jgi:tRNA threonylcarbamoyladenosine biosynthesis protein TsaB
MPLILHIDTATEHASICLSKGDEIIGFVESADQKNHAAFVQPAIQRLMAEKGYPLQELQAVSVTGGPGSYTGLRVGLASAKGICFALNKPLIIVNTLEVIARSILEHFKTKNLSINPDTLLCPMIDARRSEVFTAVYGIDLKEKVPAHARILDENAFSTNEFPNKLVFSGSGQGKLVKMIHNEQAVFFDIQHNAKHLAIQAIQYFHKEQFADLAYAEPLYVKAFHDTSKKA